MRLIHRPSGVVIAATERRSQAANREMAFERLAERLEAMSQTQAPRVATRPGRAVASGGGQSSSSAGLNRCCGARSAMSNVTL